MRKTFSRLAVLGAALAGSLALALPAAATVNPVHLQVTTAAGAYAAPTADHLAVGDHMTGVKAKFFTLPSQRFALSNGALWNSSTDSAGGPAKGPMLGVVLCTATSLTTATQAAVLFTQWNPSSNLMDVFVGAGGAGNCLDAKATVSVTQIDAIPAGHQVFLSLTQSPGGTVFWTEEDLTNDTGGFHQAFASASLYNRAGIGAQSGISDLNSPPAVKLVRFLDDSVRETSFGPLVHHWINIGNPTSTRIRTRVVDQATSGDVFVGSSLNSTRLRLDRGTLNS